MIISLTGFMGCGKSSVGRKLSELLCCRFMDLDDCIEAEAGCTISEIFSQQGEAEFRKLEQNTLKDILDSYGRGLVIPMTPVFATLGHPLAGGGMSSPSSSAPATEPNQVSGQDHSEDTSKTNVEAVLALGGGAVMTAGSEEIVHEGTVCIYLKASVDTLIEHLSGETAGRPLLSNQTVMSSEVETSPLRARILELMSLRAETYERTAHLIIETDGKTVEEVAAEIVAKIAQQPNI